MFGRVDTKAGTDIGHFCVALLACSCSHHLDLDLDLVMFSDAPPRHSDVT